MFVLASSVITVNPSLTGISKAISSGDVETLSSYFDESIEIAILDDEDFYDKDEAKEVIKTFFSKNKPKSFSQVHQGTSKGKDSKYSIGNLVTSNTSYRVYLYMKVNNGKYVIQEMRINKE